jgi:hypothetical protein
MKTVNKELLTEEFNREACANYKISVKSGVHISDTILKLFDKHKGAYAVACKLIGTDEVQIGFTKMYEADPINLSFLNFTLEAQVLNPKYASLFRDKSQILQKAKERLDAHKPGAN